MEEIYNRILFNDMIFTVIVSVIVLVGCVVLWFSSDVIKIKQKGVVVREIKLKKGVSIIVKRLLPLIVLCITIPYIVNFGLDYTKKDYLYGEGKLTSYSDNPKGGLGIDIEYKSYNLPRAYRTNIKVKDSDITYKFVYTRRTKLILYIEAVDDNEEGFSGKK